VKKYYLVARYAENYNAVSKARMDVGRILNQRDYKPVSKENLVNNSILYQKSLFVVQYPDLYYENTLQIMKLLKILKCTSIILIHDLNALRTRSISAEDEQAMLKQADFLIVHNQKMEDYLAQFSIPKNRMIRLKLFDYLFCPPLDHDVKKTVSKKKILLSPGICPRKSRPILAV
jgi:hypothetical protein